MFRHEARDHARALGDLNLLPFAKHSLDLAEPVPEVANRGFSHVIHLSITCYRTRLRSEHLSQRKTINRPDVAAQWRLRRWPD